jgi:hypothetical protein
MRWVEHVAYMEERKATYKVLVGKPEGKRPLLRHRQRWVDNIKMDLQEVGLTAWNGLVWSRTDRWQTVVNALMNLQVPYNAVSFLTKGPNSYSRRTLLHGVIYPEH